ncbi:SDR family NAD(P)-dependent oxidoreductase [Brevibacillus dissolubilis]|uniref:SDR family NAD(P)-dependent oxidoreductase n=1 Tax=Brevibacillus dissolubilis TaxID=1844116 RepID=UPI001116C07D|nr:SDR family oxidoreductase [Brevibacillus dissolubilis]
MSKTALITGASSGIGRELAIRFAQDRHNVILVARSEGKLKELADQIRTQYGVTVTIIAKDLADIHAPKEIYDQLQQAGIQVDYLANNAGIGCFGDFVTNDIDQEMQLIDLNVRALAYMSRLFLPDMVKRRHGGILNVASTAAFQPGPLMANYYASKSYVLSLTEALANELKGTGVTISALCPGPTETDFVKEAHMEGSKLFKGDVMSAKAVAEMGYDGLMAGQTIVIPGLKNKLMAWSVRLVPRKWVPGIVRKVQEKG